jgi:hypothetical protein
MGTYTVSEPSVGELRFLFRLIGLPNSYKEGNVSVTAGGTAIEGSDVYSVSGQTRSKVGYLVTMRMEASNRLESSTRPNASLTTMFIARSMGLPRSMLAFASLHSPTKRALVAHSSGTSIQTSEAITCRCHST